MLHSLGILLRAEDSNGVVVGSSAGFQAFVALHAIVETRGHAVQAEERVCNKGRWSPLSSFGGVGGLDMAVDFWRC